MGRRFKLWLLVLACLLLISACSTNDEDHQPSEQENHEQVGNEETEQPPEQDEPGETDENDESDQNDPSHDEDDGALGDGPGDEEGYETDQPEETDNGSKTEIEKIISAILEAVEHRPTMELEEEMIEDLYHLDLHWLEDYAIHLPMFNISTNEVAILKVNDVNDIPKVEEAIRQRALDVQKQFEDYLPDQYENAKNYQLVVSGSFILFVIDEKDTADQFVQIFTDYLNEHGLS